MPSGSQRQQERMRNRNKTRKQQTLRCSGVYSDPSVAILVVLLKKLLNLHPKLGDRELKNKPDEL